MRKMLVLFFVLVGVAFALYGGNRLVNSDVWRAHHFLAEIRPGMTRAEVVQIAARYHPDRLGSLATPPLGEFDQEGMRTLRSDVSFGDYSVRVTFKRPLDADDEVIQKDVGMSGEQGWLEAIIFPTERLAQTFAF